MNCVDVIGAGCSDANFSPALATSPQCRAASSDP